MRKEADILAVFYRYNLFSRDDLVRSFKMTIDIIEEDVDGEYTALSKKHKLELCRKFLAKVEKCRLPVLTPEERQFYEYEIFGDSIQMNLCKAGDIELSEDGSEVSQLEWTVESTLLRVEADYVSVDQFAKIQEVTPLTVRNWLSKGKLRHAKLKDDGEWLIPTTEDRPTRRYGYVGWTLLEPMRIDEFPLVSAAEFISIYPDREKKGSYACSFRHFQNKFWNNMEFTKSDVKELEYALVASGKARPSHSSISRVPDFDREDA